MSIEVRTPVNSGKGEVVDLARKRFRKQILPVTKITYNGQEKNFDLSYLRSVVDSFKKKAFPYVPVKLAPGDNSHTNDVLRTGGRLADVELTPEEGLVGVFELNDDGIKAVGDSDGLVGVSARLFENITHSSGKSYPVAMQHVLITDDPNIQDQSPWKMAELSAERDVTETIDLTAVHIGGEEESMDKQGEKVTLELTAAQRDRLLELAAENEELEKLNLKAEDFEPQTLPGTPGGEPVEDEDDGDEDGDEGDGTDGNDGVQLSNSATAAIELARSEAAAANAQVVELAAKLAKADVDREIGELERAGLAPAIIKLARPLLEAKPGVIELSNGHKSDTGTQVRALLKETLELARQGLDIVDLDRVSGLLVGNEDDQAAQMDLMLANMRENLD